MAILLTNGDSFTFGDELDGSRLGFAPDGSMIKPNHHHLTYTHHLANLLKPDDGYINLGANASSNQKIFRRTTTFLQQTGREVSHMVIMWSSWGRMEVVSPYDPDSDRVMYIQKENNFNQIIPDHHSGKMAYQLRHWGDNDVDQQNFGKALQHFYNYVYSFQTPIIHHLNYMCIIQDLCDAKGIKLIQGIIHHGMWENIKSCLTDRKMEKERELKDTIKFYIQYLRPECKLGFGDRMDMTSFAIDRSHEGCEIRPLGHPCEKSHELFAGVLYDKFLEIEKRDG
jgi:hypothetical protein